MLIPGKEYEIPGKTLYRGTFKHYVDNLAYFEPLYAIIKYERTPTLDWEKAVTVQNVPVVQIMERYKKDDVFFYIGACSFDRSFLQYKGDPLYFLERWARFDISDLYDNPYHFFYEWWNGKIDPYTMCPPKIKNNRVEQCEKKFSNPGKKVQSLGQYFHDQRLFKKIETP
jgi:hypothetical protein